MTRPTVYVRNADVPMWEAARQIAEWEGRKLSEIVTEALQFWLEANGAGPRVKCLLDPDQEEIVLAPFHETRIRLAAEWLQRYLGDGKSVPSLKIKKDAVAAGFHSRLIGRARDRIGARVVPIIGTRNQTAWTMSAPEPIEYTD